MPRAKTIEGRARLIRNQSLGRKVSYLTFEAPWIAETARPGQFVMVGCSPSRNDSPDPLLMRPLAVAGVEGSTIDLLVGILGRGTRILAGHEVGVQLTLRGPLGNGFPEPGRSNLVLAAGGLGAAPLLFAHRCHAHRGDLITDFILGVPDKSFKPMVDYLTEAAPGLRVFSDDGSLGSAGNVCTDLPSNPGEVWACGPVPMYRALLDSLDPEVPFRVSLEARMGCGFGGCMGCAVPTRQGQVRACCEGPVFEGREVLWHEFD